jgi:hypothetical protein
MNLFSSLIKRETVGEEVEVVVEHLHLIEN